jgi:hypothetical protein
VRAHNCNESKNENTNKSTNGNENSENENNSEKESMGNTLGFRKEVEVTVVDPHLLQTTGNHFYIA